jgi:protoporphyrinogen/coproporphyrinogen III oxidase
VKVIVVGAGIAGLAAAWELTRSGASDVLVLESERRAGGVIVTEHVDGFLIEGGPDGFLAGERDVQVLAHEIGIGDHVVEQRARGTALWNGKTLTPIEEGRAAMLLGIEAKTLEVAAGFRSFAAGMIEPVAVLSRRLGSSVRFAQGVAGLTREGDRWRLAITGGSAHEADAVILALPAYQTGRLLEAVGIRHGRALAEVVYLPSTTVSLAYRADQVKGRSEIAGFVVSPDVHSAIRACTFASAKYPGRAPDGHALLRVFIEPGVENPQQTAHTQLAGMLGIRGEPLWSRMFSWTRGLPRYHGRHREQVDDVRERLARLPPIAIAGAGYDGAGVSACVRSGKAAAGQILRAASTTRSTVSPNSL